MKRLLILGAFLFAEGWSNVYSVRDVPIDVPAIELKTYWCRDASGNNYACGGWNCEDKSRVLLTAQDGSHHCVKLPDQTKP